MYPKVLFILMLLCSLVPVHAKQYIWNATTGRVENYKSTAKGGKNLIFSTNSKGNPASDVKKCAPLFKMMKSQDVKSLGLLVKNAKGETLFESYDLSSREFGAKSRANVFSISKFTTLGVVGVLSNKGAPHIPGLNLDTTLGKCMPGFSSSDKKREIKVRDLLSHTSGIEFCELEDCGATDSLKMACTKTGRSDVIGYISKQGYDGTKRGKHYNYSSANYVLLERCMQNLAAKAGKDYASLKKQALKLLGAKNVSFGKAGSGKNLTTMAGSEASMNLNSLYNLGDSIIDNPGRHMSKEVGEFIHKPNPGLCKLAKSEIESHGATYTGFWGNVSKFCSGSTAKTRYFPEMEEEMKYVAGHGGTWYFSLPKQKLRVAIIGANRSHGHLYKPFLRRVSRCFGNYSGKDLGDWTKKADSTPTASGQGLTLEKIAKMSDTVLQKPLTNCHALFSCLCIHGNYQNSKKNCDNVGAKQFTLPKNIAGKNLIGMSSKVTGAYMKKLPKDLQQLVSKVMAGNAAGSEVKISQSLEADSTSATSKLFLTLRGKSGKPTTLEFSRAKATMKGESRQCEMTQYATRPSTQQVNEAMDALGIN